MIWPSGPVQTASGFPDAPPGAFDPPGALGISPDGFFTLNGQKRFLLLGSYFGALRDAIFYPQTMIDIFNSAKTYGFDGVRVFPTWWWDYPAADLCGPAGSFDQHALFLGDGSINYQPLSGAAPIPLGVYQPPGNYQSSVAGRMQFLLDQAWQHGLVVDLSFAPETVAGLWDRNGDRGVQLVKYGTALSTFASILRTLTYEGPPDYVPITGYKHALFDNANESNYAPTPPNPPCKPIFTEPEIAQLLAGVRYGDPSDGDPPGDPERKGTASRTGGEPPDNWAISDQMTANFVAYHEPRDPYQHNLGPPECRVPREWWQMTFYRAAGLTYCEYTGYRQLTNLPIYFQEEEKHVYLPESGCNQNAYTPAEAGPGCVNNYTWDLFMTSAVGAKQGRAAAWTWHTSKLFRFASNYNAQLTETEVMTYLNLRPYLDTVQPWP